MHPFSLHIRRAVVGDAAAFARIMGEPAVLANLMQVPYTSEALWQASLSDSLAPGKPSLLLVAERPDAHGDLQVVANAGLHPVSLQLRRRHVMGLGIAVHGDAQGQGVGRALIAALCDWADRWGQVLRIELTVFVDHPQAITLYEKFGFRLSAFGFRQECRHVGYALRDGRYVDTFSMVRLHPDPPRLGGTDSH